MTGLPFGWFGSEKGQIFAFARFKRINRFMFQKRNQIYPLTHPGRRPFTEIPSSSTHYFRFRVSTLIGRREEEILSIISQVFSKLHSISAPREKRKRKTASSEVVVGSVLSLSF